LITDGVGKCAPLSFEYCSIGKLATVEQRIPRARAIVGIAIACARVAELDVKMKGEIDPVLLKGAGVDAASTVIGAAGVFGMKKSNRAIRQIIALCQPT
jgi:hypothetical protein